MNLLLKEIGTWLYNNRLTPNLLKTKLMLFSPKVVNCLPDVYFDDIKLEWVRSMRYLGVILDDKLNFIPECNSVARKLSAVNGVIYSMSNQMPQNVLLKLYYSLAYPCIIQSVIF